MITFDLACESEHRFEGWFRNGEDFDEQMSRGLVQCPLCGSRRISKRPSAVAVHVARRAGPNPNPNPNPNQGDAAFPPAKAAPPAPEAFFRGLSEFLEKNFEDVGAAFAREARRIDAGESEPRNIRGTTSAEEEETLREEGVEFFKVALPKYDA